ncbi:unnamed protein product, partial [Enterobius vermicularis]|uniref:Uncharacterized protein n=1 Tax=Enterobius vermicularis TaxID=51028 RepID=A0A158QAE2_ENTVE
MPEVFVDFIQGGNNLEGLYVKLEDGEKPEWNLLLAIIHSINTPAIPGGGDEQNVATPYGFCHYRFSKPRDKRFRRQMDRCTFEGISNHSLLSGMTLHSYKQDIMYYLLASSNIVHLTIAGTASAAQRNLSYSKTQFDSGIFQRNEFALEIGTNKRRLPLFGVSVFLFFFFFF